jgi:stress responsive alpha/beta barrel protein
MICHVVLYRMKQGTSEVEETQLIEVARKILPTLPGVRNLKVGRSLRGSERGYAIALVMDFENAAALEAYRVNASYQQFVRGVVEPLVEDIWRFDFEWN